MPWPLPDALKRFQALTMGKPMLMERKTFESIGKPLPWPPSLVMTRDSSWRADGVIVVHSMDEAFARAGAVPEISVVGGADVFRLALPLAKRIYLTSIHASIPGDTYFPPIEPAQ